MIKNFNIYFRRITASRRMLPSLIIIGVQKGATTSVFNYLSQHPQIGLPRKKQLHFFDRLYSSNINAYKAYFPLKGKHKATFEATPYYFFHPLAPQRMFEMLGKEAKFVLLLRDPVERAVSHYNMCVNKYEAESRSFEQAIAGEFDMIKDEEERIISSGGKYYSWRHRRKGYISRGFYWKQMENWLKYFDRSNFLAIDMKDLQENTQQTLAEIEDFMGVDHHNDYDIMVHNKGAYSFQPENYQELYDMFEKDNLQFGRFFGKEFSWFNKFKEVKANLQPALY